MNMKAKSLGFLFQLREQITFGRNSDMHMTLLLTRRQSNSPPSQRR